MRYAISHSGLWSTACVSFVIGAIAGAIFTSPALAQNATHKINAVIACAITTTACDGGKNTSSGPGVLGASASGSGVIGNAGSSGAGVYGSSKSGHGVQAISSTGDAIYGASTGGNGITTSASTGLGALLQSSSYYGAEAIGGYGGIYAISSSFPLVAQSGSGLFYVNNNATAVMRPSTGNWGADISVDGGLPFHAVNSSGNGSDVTGSYIGLLGRAPTGTGSFPLVLTDTSANNVFYVDGDGDVSYSGSLNHVTAVRGGATAIAYHSDTTAPTIEDTGFGRIAGGVGIVRLNPVFAGAIDVREGYHVFLTPNGDTRGLYVASKRTNAFIVREVLGGRGNVEFDYRVVATPLGAAGERMAITRAAPRAPIVQAQTAMPRRPKL